MTGDFKVFIFDQPTTGVDIGRRRRSISRWSHWRKGLRLIFISSENEELMGICDRIAVMTRKDRQRFDAGNVTEHDILLVGRRRGRRKRRQEMLDKKNKSNSANIRAFFSAGNRP
ncbi:MAG: hypothetical protein ACLVJO_04165 [[Clostridium] scindens]